MTGVGWGRKLHVRDVTNGWALSNENIPLKKIIVLQDVKLIKRHNGLYFKIKCILFFRLITSKLKSLILKVLLRDNKKG